MLPGLYEAAPLALHITNVNDRVLAPEQRNVKG